MMIALQCLRRWPRLLAGGPLLIILASSLAACSAGEDYVRPDPMQMELPKAFSGTDPSTAPTNLSTWWHLFGDPVLDDLVAEAAKNNTSLQIAFSRLKQAEAQENVTRADSYPSASGSASGAVNRTNGATSDTYSGSLGVSWVLDLFGAQRRANEAARADTQAWEADLRAAQTALVADVAKAYLSWRGAGERLAIAQRNLESQKETLQFIRWQTESGLVSDLTRQQAEASVAQNEASLPGLETLQTQYANRLATLVGVTPEHMRDKLAQSDKTSPAPPSGLAVDIPANVLRQRPDVQKAERNLAAATARVGEAEAALYPSFSLSGSIGLSALGLSQITNGATVSRSLVGSLAQTVFDAGRLRQRLAISTEAQEQAFLTYKATIQSALEEVENALKAYAGFIEQEKSLAVAAAAANNAASLAEMQYKAGTVDYLTVLTSESTRLSAEDALASVRLSKLSALVSLYTALGGGWEAPR